MYRLVADEVRGEGRWLWRLFDPGGVPLAHHEVDVDTASWEWHALRDLPRGIAPHTDPAEWLASEARLVEQVGRWVSEHVLGDVAEGLASIAPASVLIEAPATILRLPLSMASIDGRTLTARRLAFAGAVPDAATAPVPKSTTDGSLRVLAVFSVPDGQDLLDLRRERKQLSDLVARLVGSSGLAIDLKVLQYGATADELRRVLLDGAGWDIVHFSGHGEAGTLVLEDESGRPSFVPTADVVTWLREARRRLKLVSLSACSSAELPVIQTMQALGIDVEAPQEAAPASPATDRDVLGQGLALDIGREAQCPVVAMRYPVIDDFAIDFGLHLYESLWERGLAVADAVALASRMAAGDTPSFGAPALSIHTPAVFGTDALTAHLVPPPEQDSGPVDTRMAQFDPEPELFVGRVGVMTAASRALAPKSGSTGVVFHGMAGAGKTSCALELAYGQKTRFRQLIWVRGPDDSDTASSAAALQSLVTRLDESLGVALVDKLDDDAQLARALALLTEAVEARAVLVVLDNAETLLTSTGRWIDPRWGAVIDALLAHRGLGRLVMTTRRLPATPLPGMTVEAIHALSPEESVLLARRLPNLSKLLADQRGATRSGLSVARQVLEVAGGHPKLLTLADAAAADAERLGDLIDRAWQRWTDVGVDPGHYLDEGYATVDGAVDTYISVLSDWASAAMDDLSPPARTLLGLCCRLDEDDRWGAIAEAAWSGYWKGGEDEEAPAFSATLEELVDRALVDVSEVPGQGTARLTIHPVVVGVALARTAPDTQRSIDMAIAALWVFTVRGFREQEARGEAASARVAGASRRAATYLTRLGKWASAAQFLSDSVARDTSPAGQAHHIRMARRIAAECEGTEEDLDARILLATALSGSRTDEALALFVQIETEAVAVERFDLASRAATHIAGIHRIRGRTHDALEAVERASQHTAAGGLGSMAELNDRLERLILLQSQGQTQEALDAAVVIIGELEDLLAEDRGDQTAVVLKIARESALELARNAAVDLEDWPQALRFGLLATESHSARGAHPVDVARSEASNYIPLVRLGRADDARQILERSRQVFAAHGDAESLGPCLSSLADVADGQGHVPQSIELELMALRYKYQAAGTELIAVSHLNLSNYYERNGEVEKAVPHRWAATAIRKVTGDRLYRRTMVSLGTVLEERVVDDFDALCRLVGEVDGVDLARVMRSLGADGDAVMAAVRAEIASLGPEDRSPPIAPFAEYVIALLLVDGVVARATALLDELDLDQADHGALRAVGRIRSGERDPVALEAGLDWLGRAVVRRALMVLDGTVAPARGSPVDNPHVAPVVARLAGADGGSMDDALVVLDAMRTGGWSALVDSLVTVLEGGPVVWDNLDLADAAVMVAFLVRAGRLPVPP